MSHKFLALILFLGFLIPSYGQLSQDETIKIDELFKTWQEPNHPGGSIGIMQNERIVYLKAYGLASLEYQIPNETTTLFNVASVSKQFTAMGIVLLYLQGKIDIDENINTYLPDMPEFEYSVTTRQMLHHTSGLRSLHAMLELAGWREDDLRTNEDLYRFVEKQKDLNFRPNDEYLYCNTGYMLMAKIIENVTGEKFSFWMKNNVFSPLGMSHTYVEDKYNSVVANNATSYYRNENTYERAVEFWGYVGSGNVHTTAVDLLTWLSNFGKPQNGWESAFKMMQTLDYLNNGILNNYAFGVNIDSLKGHRRIQHGGSIGGYRASLASYPNSGMSIAILTNFSSSNPKKIMDEISKIILSSEQKTFDKKANQDKYPIKIESAKKNLRLVKGDYWSKSDLSSLNIKLKNDTIKLVWDTRKEESLIPVSTYTFRSEESPNTLYMFRTKDEEISGVQILEPMKDTVAFKKYTKTIPSVKELKEYEGRYNSDELETFYDIYFKSGNLYSHHPRHGDFKIEWIKEDVLKGQYPFSFLEIQRNTVNEIIGLKVSNGRVKHAWFKKIGLKF